MDELLTYTEGDSDTPNSSPAPAGEVISEGPVLVGPIDLPKVDDFFKKSQEKADKEDTPEPGDAPEAIETGGTIAVGAVHGEAAVEDSSDAPEVTAIAKVADQDDTADDTADDDHTKADLAEDEDDNAEDDVADEDVSDESNEEADKYAEFVDDFWSPVQYNEHDTSARIVRTGSIVLGGVALAVTAIALVLPVFGVPEGTTLAGIPVSSQEDGPKAVETLQQQLDQTAFSLTNKRGETITKSGAELGLKVDGERTTKGLNSWINRSGVWIQRVTGKVTLPIVVSSGDQEALTEAAKAITLNIKEPEVTLTATGAQSTPGVDGYETDKEMLVAGLTDTISNVTSQPGDWKAAPVEVITTGRTLSPNISPADVEAVTAQWNHVLNTPVTLTKAVNMPSQAPTIDPSLTPSASASASSEATKGKDASEASEKSASEKSEKGSEKATEREGAKASDKASKSSSASPTATQSGKKSESAYLDVTNGVAGVGLPSFGGMTLVNHMVLAQAETPKASESVTPNTTEAEPAAGATPAADGTIKVEEGEGESQAGEQNVQDEQTAEVTAHVEGDLQLSKEDKLAITQVIQDMQAEPGSRLKLEVKADALPDTLTNFFAANTMTKGLKAHIEGEQDPPAKAAAADKSLHDASRVKGKVVVESMEDGFVPDETATLNAVLQAAKGNGGSVHLIGLEDKVSSPESLGIKEPISTFTSFFSPGQSRVKNIHRIADLVDGVVVGPGQSFELNKHVGRRTRKNGFTDGGAIQEGHMVSEVGGGVSQFATTFFNAAWFSGVLIPQHKAHSQYFARYPAGREATLNYPGVNLEIINDTPYAILIDTSHTSSSVTVTFWSTKYWEVDSERGKCLCVPHASFPVTWTRTRTNPDGKSEKWSVTTYYQSPKPKKKDD